MTITPLGEGRTIAMTDVLTRIPVELSIQFNKIVIDMKAPVVVGS